MFAWRTREALRAVVILQRTGGTIRNRPARSGRNEGFRMRFHSLSSLLLAAGAVLGHTAIAEAGFVATFEVGSGSSASNLQFQFANGNSYLYIVHWDLPQTGRSLFDIAFAAQPDFFSFETESFPFGEALFSVGIGADTNSGFGTRPEFLDFWHYWVRDSSNDQWGFASTGFADRVVTAGSWDGWVFGSDGPPIAVPAPTALLVLAGIGARRCRQR